MTIRQLGDFVRKKISLVTYKKGVDMRMKSTIILMVLAAMLVCGVAISTGYADAVIIPQKDHNSAEWYQKAAEQGDAASQLILGTMYFEGRGVAQSYSKAVEWYQKAADQGEPDALFYLGMMYWYGIGAPMDKAKGEELLQKSAQQGNKSAKEMLEGPCK